MPVREVEDPQRAHRLRLAAAAAGTASTAQTWRWSRTVVQVAGNRGAGRSFLSRDAAGTTTYWAPLRAIASTPAFAGVSTRRKSGASSRAAWAQLRATTELPAGSTADTRSRNWRSDAVRPGIAAVCS